MQVDTHRLVRFFDQKTFYTVHGDSALFIARQYYRTTAVIKYFGSVDTGLPGERCHLEWARSHSTLSHIVSCRPRTQQVLLRAACIATLRMAVSSVPADGSIFAAAGVTLNRSLYERVLRDLLVERAEHTVELHEGSGASWSLAR